MPKIEKVKRSPTKQEIEKARKGVGDKKQRVTNNSDREQAAARLMNQYSI